MKTGWVGYNFCVFNAEKLGFSGQVDEIEENG